MGKLRIYTEVEKLDIVKKYTEDHISIENIAKEYKAGRGSIHRVLVEQGVHIRTAKDLYEKTVPEDIQEKIIYNYTQLGMGLIPSGAPYGVSEYMVKKVLKQNNIYIRSYTESKDNLRIYTCNDDYFKTQSPNMAYILGLLASDGNVAKNENKISIALEERDTEILEKIGKEMQISRPVETYVRLDGSVNSKLQVHSSAMKRDLAHYSIVPAKTFILQPPELLKPEYYIDYIRGYFDGDGSIYINSDWSYGANISGASKAVISWIQKILAEKYNIVCTKLESIPRLSENRNYYRITYYGPKVLALYKSFYHNNDVLYMKRKKDVFEEILMNYYPRDYESLVKGSKDMLNL